MAGRSISMHPIWLHFQGEHVSLEKELLTAYAVSAGPISFLIATVACVGFSIAVSGSSLYLLIFIGSSQMTIAFVVLPRLSRVDPLAVKTGFENSLAAFVLTANAYHLFFAEVPALTPISAFRPRRWRGAILPDRSKVKFRILEPEKRPVLAVADQKELRDIAEVTLELARESELTLLFDKGHALDERIVAEQFAT